MPIIYVVSTCLAIVLGTALNQELNRDFNFPISNENGITYKCASVS